MRAGRQSERQTGTLIVILRCPYRNRVTKFGFDKSDSCNVIASHRNFTFFSSHNLPLAQRGPNITSTSCV